MDVEEGLEDRRSSMADETPGAPGPAADPPEDLSELGALTASFPVGDATAPPVAPVGLATNSGQIPAAAPFPPPAPARTPGPTFCPRCGAPRTSTLSRCDECGYRFAVRCPRCGAINTGEATTCASCGHHLISAAHGAWMVGPPRPHLAALRGSAARGTRGSAAKRRGLKSRSPGHSPLFFFIIASGAIVLALGVILLLLILAQNPHLLGNVRPMASGRAIDHTARLALRWCSRRPAASAIGL